MNIKILEIVAIGCLAVGLTAPVSRAQSRGYVSQPTRFSIRLENQDGDLGRLDSVHFYRVTWRCAGNLQATDIKSGDSKQWTENIFRECLPGDPFRILRVQFIGYGETEDIAIMDVNYPRNYEAEIVISVPQNGAATRETRSPQTIRCGTCDGKGWFMATANELDSNRRVVRVISSTKCRCSRCDGTGYIQSDN